MAFGFFRRHQKLVIIVMAVLMGLWGVSSYLARGWQTSNSDEAYGTLAGGQTVTILDIRQANSDLQFLQAGVLPIRQDDIGFLLLASDEARNRVAQRLFFEAVMTRRQAQQQPNPYEEQILARMVGDFMGRIATINAEGQRGRAYALLVAEARSMNLSVSQAEIEMYFMRVGAPLESDAYSEMMTGVRKYFADMTDEHLQGIVARWLLVQKAFDTAAPNSPPSIPRLQHLYSELTDRINLRMAAMYAEPLANDIPAPSDEQVQAMFEAYRTVRSGTYTPEKPFGFGYFQPDRVALVWLMIPEDVIERVVRVDMAEARRIYRDNRSSYVRQEPVEPPATAPATQVTTEPAAEPVMRTVQKTLAEALPEIVSEQRANRANRETSKLVGRIQDRLQQAMTPATDATATQPAGPGEAFSRVYNDLIDRAAGTEALARKIANVSFKDTPLSEAVETLAADARLSGIAYPYDRPVLTGPEGKGAEMLRGSATVTLEASDIPLGEALDRISKQLKVPELQWVGCTDFGGALFALSSNPAADTFPVVLGNSGLLDQRALAAHPILGNSFTAKGRSGATLASMALRAEGLDLPKDTPAVMKVGRLGMDMHVSGFGRFYGQLIWTLSDVQPSAEPKKLTDEIRAQVVRDWRLQKAYETKVRSAAKALETTAAEKGIEAAAQAADIKTTTTGMFTRREISRRTPWEPNDFPLGSVPGIDLPYLSSEQGQTVRKALLDQAFALEPASPEPPYPAARRVGLLEVPAVAGCFVVERIDYQPPVRSEFEKNGRSVLFRELQQAQVWDARRDWFTYDNIVKRTGFTPANDQDDQASDARAIASKSG